MDDDGIDINVDVRGADAQPAPVNKIGKDRDASNNVLQFFTIKITFLSMIVCSGLMCKWVTCQIADI